MTASEHNVQVGVPLIGIPPEALLRGDRTLRYERGGRVYATDGKVGTLRQAVIDEAAGEIVALVIEIDKTGVQVLLSVQAVGKTAGSAVFLNGSCRQFAEWAEQAPGYQPTLAVRADPKALLRARSRSDGDPRRVILKTGRDFLETRGV